MDRFDVIVVGGGGSGLAAAASAAEGGARVLLVEKAKTIGGTTALAIGSITATQTRLQRLAGIHDHPDSHFDDIAKFSDGTPSEDRPDLRRVLVDHVTETVAWLEAKGISFFGPMPEPPHSKPRMINALPNARAYIYFLEKACRNAGVEIRTSCAVKDLILENDVVVGIEVAGEHGAEQIGACAGVILATGDFSGGKALKSVFMPSLEPVDPINPSNTGDGQLIAQKHGSNIINGHLAYAELRFIAPQRRPLLARLPPSRALTSFMRWSLANAPAVLLRPFILSFVTTFLAPDRSLFSEGAILVNDDGDRIDLQTKAPHLALAQQPNKVGYIVFGQAVATRFNRWPHFVSTAPGIAYAYLDDYRRNRKDLFHLGENASELADKLGMSAEALAKSVPGGPDQRVYALGPVKGWVVFTEGGANVDEDHSVIRSDGSRISGLLAVGSAGQGGLLLNGHGHHLAWAFTSGRRAGKWTAAQARIINNGSR